jgi:carbonic anhydrase
MRLLHQLFDRNKKWADRLNQQDPGFFKKLSEQQSPEYLWIGCSDSRVPANEIVDLLPGELFVHRNVANVVVHTDLNCLSVLQFAVDVLKVKHVIVVGHYGCGGVKAALQNGKLGLIDNWLRHIQDIYHTHRSIIDPLPTEEQRVDKLCELNVIEQTVNVARTTIIQDAWSRNQNVAVHGWIYGLKDGLLTDLKCTITSPSEVSAMYDEALHALSTERI